MWVFTPGHGTAGVTGKKGDDSLADAAVADNNLTLDAPTVIQIVTEHLIKNRPNSSANTLDRLKEKSICPGDGAKSDKKGFQKDQQLTPD